MQTLVLSLIFLAGSPASLKDPPKVAAIVLTPQEEKRMQQFAPMTLKKIEKGKPLDVYDIRLMTRMGLADEIILAAIAKTNSTFYLTSSDIKELRQGGVSQKVIEDMNETGKHNYK
ncbi:MAG: hypothetical protein K940chlam2_01291 [Chlamydiae bacterium]|nr:hypothetical protein [Chlamydiota bacterium]